ncbi:LAFE_0B09010g1_1 [Lachancea fermentati]|uniref:LAFE_0B09010g1_1 n=1 Tax=Lachancea fermentati TaxID=4955 RepID=A0A1G4M8B0_LACFM|nr:LAFE_0B09010g1_1 [Lachancea fermentati]
MPGQIVSIPFLSQIEDMDKYLLEYRSLKLMPQNAVSFTQPQMRYNVNRAMNNGVGGGNTNTRKKLLNNTNGVQVYRYNNNTTKYGQQSGSGVMAQTQNGSGGSFKPAYPQMFYGAGNSSSMSLPQVPSPTLYGAAQTQQQFMTASSSSSSTPPPILHASISGTSSISSLGGEYEYLLPNEVNGQYMSSNSAGNSVPTSTNVTAPSTATMSSGYLDSVVSAPAGFKIESAGSSSTDFINGLPSSLLSEGMNPNGFLAGTTNNTNSFFGNTVSYPSSGSNATTSSSSNFMMQDSKGWGNNNANTSSNTGSFGIWNNDMSVWS